MDTYEISNAKAAKRAKAKTSDVPYVALFRSRSWFRTNSMPGRWGKFELGAAMQNAPKLQVFGEDGKWHPVICFSDEYAGPFDGYPYKDIEEANR